MRYVFFTLADDSSQPLKFFSQLSQMGTRSITWEQPQQKPEQSSTSSWTSTLFKAAFVGAALTGAAYVGYRQGFFDGAIEVAKTAYDRGFLEGAAESVKTAAKQPTCTIDSDAIFNLVKTSEVREELSRIVVPQIVKEAAENNPFIQPSVEGFTSMIPNVNTTAIQEEWNQLKSSVSSGMYTTQLALITLGTIWFSSMIVRNCRGGR